MSGCCSNLVRGRLRLPTSSHIEISILTPTATSALEWALPLRMGEKAPASPRRRTVAHSVREFVHALSAFVSLPSSVDTQLSAVDIASRTILTYTLVRLYLFITRL